MLHPNSDEWDSLFLFTYSTFVSDDSINDNDDNSTDKNEDERTSAASYDEDVSDNSTDSPYQQNEAVSIANISFKYHTNNPPLPKNNLGLDCQ